VRQNCPFYTTYDNSHDNNRVTKTNRTPPISDPTPPGLYAWVNTLACQIWPRSGERGSTEALKLFTFVKIRGLGRFSAAFRHLHYRLPIRQLGIVYNRSLFHLLASYLALIGEVCRYTVGKKRPLIHMAVVSTKFWQILYNIWHTVYWVNLRNNSYGFIYLTYVLQLLHYLGKQVKRIMITFSPINHSYALQLHNWSEKWQIKFNGSKCKAMHLIQGNNIHFICTTSPNSNVEP